jgi:hypothetical protein
MTTSCLATDVIVAVRRRDDDLSDQLLWELAQSFVGNRLGNDGRAAAARTRANGARRPGVAGAARLE